MSAFIPRRRRRLPRIAGIVAPLLLLLLTAAGAADAAPKHISGWALVGPEARVHGGLVEVWTIKGRSLLAGRADRTSMTGTFDVAVRRVPRLYVVSVRGGHVGRRRIRGTLGIVVRNGKPGRKLNVTPITTLIAARVGLHRSVPRGEREIRRLLRLPRWHDLYGDVRHDASAFDGSRFMRAAQRNGGLDRYVARIDRLVGRRTVAFRGKAKPKAKASIAIDPMGIAKDLAGKGASWGLSKFLEAIGFSSDTTARDLAEIKQQLKEISAQLVEVRRQLDGVERQLARVDYNTAVLGTELRWIGGPDDDVKNDIDWLIDNAVACKANDPDAECDTYIPANKRATRWCSVTLPQLDDDWRRGDPSLQPAQTTCAVLANIKTRVLDKSGFNTWDTDIVGNGKSGGVLPTYQALAYTDTKRSGFVTQGYHDELKLVGAQIAWKTLLIASYAVEYERMDAGSERKIQRSFDTAVARIARQEALLPPRLPANTAIDPRSGLMWSVLENPAKSCGGASTGHRWLWFPSNADAVPDKNGCAAQWNTALARNAGLGGWSVSDRAMLQKLVDTVRRPGRSLAEGLKEQLGFADLSVVASAFAPPPVDTGLLRTHAPISWPSRWHGNDGTAAGLGTGSCSEGPWYLGWEYSANAWTRVDAQVQASLCDYLRLDNAEVRALCVQAFRNFYADANRLGMPCNAPSNGVLRLDLSRYIRTGPLSFGHPLVYLVKRTVGEEENWFRTP